MKKTLILIAVVAMGLTSCKKDRTCTCTYTSDAPGSVSYTSTQMEGHVTKKGGKRLMGCYSYTSQTTGSPYTTTATCDLK